MLDQQQGSAIEAAVRRACDVLRGVMAIEDCRDFVLAMLLLKYLSDIAEPVPGEESFEHPKCVVPAKASFHTLYMASHQSGNGARINSALAALESANAELRGIFDGIQFDSPVLGNAEQKDRLLRELLHIFGTAGGLSFRTVRGDAAQAVAYACDSLIRITAATAGKRGGEFFTPPEISQLMARLMGPKPGEAIGDPCCGSGSLLIECSRLAREKSGQTGCALYGQEINGSNWALARMNMILHGESQYHLAWGDTLRQPKLLAPDGSLRKFEVVVSTPPFSLRDWGHEEADHDVHRRYRRGVPPRASGDYAFLSHMVETLDPTIGRMAAVVSLGVLFRGGAEHQIRERLIQENLIDSVIALPPKMFSHTGIPVALLVLRMSKADEGVLFIDASSSYRHGKTQNTLRPEDLDRIERAYRTRNNEVRYARFVTRDELAANDYNLTVARYVEPGDEEPEFDLAALRQERARLNAELAALEAKLATLLNEAAHA